MFIFTLLDELHTEESFRKKLRIYSAAYHDVFYEALSSCKGRSGRIIYRRTAYKYLCESEKSWEKYQDIF